MDKNGEFAAAARKSVFNRSHTIAASTYKKPEKPAFDRSATVKKSYNLSDESGDLIKGKVRLLRNLFEPPKKVESVTVEAKLQPQSSSKLKQVYSFTADSVLNSSSVRLPGTEDRVVVYFTSLRGVRRTFEDCYAVRSILRAYRVYVDERDVSMDSSYKRELQSIIRAKNVTLPQVFIKGRLIGGAEIIKQLNEIGDLRKILEILPLRERGVFCDACGDIRFVPCSNCSGSRKVFDEDEGVTKRCLNCNENGLIRCPTCLR